MQTKYCMAIAYLGTTKECYMSMVFMGASAAPVSRSVGDAFCWWNAVDKPAAPGILLRGKGRTAFIYYPETNAVQPVGSVGTWGPGVTQGMGVLIGTNAYYVVNCTLMIYDTVTNTTTNGPSGLLAKCNYAAAAPYANRTGHIVGLIMCGGYTTSSIVFTDTCEIYMIATNTWSFTMQPMPTAVIQMAMALINGMVFVFCGTVSTVPTTRSSTVFMYNGMAWTVKASAPWAVTMPAAMPYSL